MSLMHNSITMNLIHGGQPEGIPPPPPSLPPPRARACRRRAEAGARRAPAIRIQGHPRSHPIFTMVSMAPEIGIPDIEPNTDPESRSKGFNIRCRVFMARHRVGSNPILGSVSGTMRPDVGTLPRSRHRDRVPISGFQ